jgi:hypothetical protein
MTRIREVLLSRFGPGRRPAAQVVAGLPAYRIALWPDGWELEADGGVRVCDTHAMAEARRWYALSERAASRGNTRVMALHGVFVPRAIVDLAGRRFPTEEVASVAVQLIAGDWVRQRRAELLREPERALRERALAWRGSRHVCGQTAAQIGELLQGMLALCIADGLIPDADYRLRVRPDAGYGICAHRCRVEVGLEPADRTRVADVLNSGLVPWNRAVVRDGSAVPLLTLSLCAPRETLHWGR